MTAGHDDPQLHGAVQDADVVNGYRFFLGRDPESLETIADKRDATRDELVAKFMESDEYEERVVRPLLDGRTPAGGHFANPPSEAILAWAIGFLPLAVAGADQLALAPSWLAAHAIVLADPGMREALPQLGARWSLETLTARTQALLADLGRRSVAGEVEEATGQVVRGYVIDQNATSDILGVELWIDGLFVAAVRADGYSRELQERFGGSGRHAFLFEGFAPPDPDDERALRVEVRESGSKLVLGAQKLIWRPGRDSHHLAELAVELRRARKALAGIERTLQLVSGALGFTPENYDAYWRAYYARTALARASRGAGGAGLHVASAVRHPGDRRRAGPDRPGADPGQPRISDLSRIRD